MFKRWLQRLQEARTREALSKLDDRTLKDLGINRNDIYYLSKKVSDG